MGIEMAEMKQRFLIPAFVAALLWNCVPDRSGESFPQAVKVHFACPQPSVIVPESATQASFAIESNVPWNVRILEGADWIDEYTAGGVCNGSVDLKFSQNSSSAGERSVLLRVWSPQDESVTLDLKLTQEGRKFLEASLSESSVGYASCQVVMQIRANVAWAIESEGLSFSVQEGDGNADVTIDVPEHKEYNEREFVIKVVPELESLPAVRLVLKQKGPFAPVKLYFNPSDWNPVLTPPENNVGFTGSYTYLPEGYSVEFCCSDDSTDPNYAYRGFSSNTVSGKAAVRFNTNKAIAGWIKLPCPDDRRIKSISLFCPNTSNKYFSVYSDISHNDVLGEGMTDVATVKNSSCTFGSQSNPWLKQPSVGQTLYLYSISNNAYISELVIEFE